MNYRYLILFGIVLLFVIGYFQLRAAKLYLIEKIAFLKEYRSKFIQLANSVKFESLFGVIDKLDSHNYTWLTLNALKIQTSIGMLGLIDYMPSFQNYVISNYQVIVNTIPKFRNNNIMRNDITMVDDTIIRSIGFFQEVFDRTENDSKNPFKWFQAGFKYILSLPLKLLVLFGLVSEERIDSIIGSSIYKFISGLVGLISFLSAIVTITTGWKPFVGIIKRIFD